MMKHNYHLRHAFIIFPTVGVLIEKHGQGLGHQQMLAQMGFSSQQVSDILERIPRGYYRAGDLCFYQGKDFKPLSPENVAWARFYWPELKTALGLAENVRTYSGIIAGQLGSHWMPMHQLNLREKGE